MALVFAQLGLGSPEALRTGAVSISGMMGAVFASSLIGMLVAALVQAALTRAVVSANEGRPVTFGESLSTGFRVMLPLIALTILFIFAVGIGFIFLVVPGVILLLMWAVAIPVLVIERLGVFASLGRSAELTKGARWKILGLFLLLIVIYLLLSAVLAVVGLKMYSPATAAGGIRAANLIGSIIVSTIFNMLWGTIQPSLYVELRQAKEGVGVEDLQDVFA
jgi:hypothetical protein